jgi:hypothetical protein
MGIDNIDQPVEYSKAQVDQGPAAAADLLAQTQSRLNLLANLMRNTSLDLGALLQQIIGDLGQALPQADIRIIYLYDEHYQALVPTAYAGYDTAFLGQIRLKPGESISGRAYQNGLPCLTQTPPK